MLPDRNTAEDLLKDAQQDNPGGWVNHSRITARCAEQIAGSCADMDSEKAYILGLLHDIGRKFGIKHMGHIYDGYHYMQKLGYDEAAKICLTHSFSIQNIHDYIGNFDIKDDEIKELEEALAAVEYDDYDRLIQLCDSMAGAEGVMTMEDRMSDVARRYGSYPQEKWDKNMALKDYFSEKTGRDIYEIVGYQET